MNSLGTYDLVVKDWVKTNKYRPIKHNVETGSPRNRNLIDIKAGVNLCKFTLYATIKPQVQNSGVTHDLTLKDWM